MAGKCGRALRAASAVSLLVGVLAGPSVAHAQDEKPPAPSAVAQRATLLAVDLEPSAARAGVERVIPPVQIVLGGATLVLAVSTVPRDPMGWAFVAEGASLLGAGIISASVSADYTLGIAGISFNVLLGAQYLGMGWSAAGPTDRDPVFPPAAGLLIGGGFLGGALLRGVDMALQRPVSLATLAVHYRRIRTPARRDALSAADLAAIESDFARSAGYLSPWIVHAPVYLSGAAALVYSLAADGYGTSARTWGAVAAGSAMLIGLGFAAAESTSGYRLYEDHLHTTGFSMSLGPGPGAGLAIRGRFE
jgi:hypothetical protein